MHLRDHNLSALRARFLMGCCKQQYIYLISDTATPQPSTHGMEVPPEQDKKALSLVQNLPGLAAPRGFYRRGATEAIPWMSVGSTKRVRKRVPGELVSVGVQPGQSHGFP